jgi:hypothetical protein
VRDQSLRIGIPRLQPGENAEFAEVAILKGATGSCRWGLHFCLKTFIGVYVVVPVYQEPRVISVSYLRNGGLSVAIVRKIKREYRK